MRLLITSAAIVADGDRYALINGTYSALKWSAREGEGLRW